MGATFVSVKYIQFNHLKPCMNPHYCLRDTNAFDFYFLIPCAKMTRKSALLLNIVANLVCFHASQVLFFFFFFLFPLLVIRGWGIEYIALGKSGVSNMLLLHS